MPKKKKEKKRRERERIYITSLRISHIKDPKDWMRKKEELNPVS